MWRAPCKTVTEKNDAVNTPSVLTVYIRDKNIVVEQTGGTNEKGEYTVGPQRGLSHNALQWNVKNQRHTNNMLSHSD
jgi:hypothetical protein